MVESKIIVEVAWMPTDQSVRSASVWLEEGSRIEDCVQALSLSCDGWLISRQGRKAALHDTVQLGDCITLSQPLRIDPKHARRRRAVSLNR